MAQSNISEGVSPGNAPGELTRPDFLFRGSSGGVTAVSNKSRTRFDASDPTAVRRQVRADIEEAVNKYAGDRGVRRAEGERIDVNRIWLLYDGVGLTPDVRHIIRNEVARVDDFFPGLVVDVGIF